MGLSLRQFVDPESSARVRWAGALLCALVLTAAIRFADESIARRTSHDYGLVLGRQVASQAEGLALAAAQKNMPKPLDWALFHLAQGVEPRYLQISRQGSTLSDGVSTSKEGVIEVRKSISIPGKDERSGVRVTVTLPPARFLGTTSNLARDAATLVLFLAIAGIAGMILQVRSDACLRGAYQGRRARVVGILPELRKTVVQMGRQLRELFDQFDELSGASREAHCNVANARTRVHQSILAARKILKRADELSGRTIHAETAVLNVMVGSSRPAEKPAVTAYSMHLLHQQLVEIRALCATLQTEVRELEQRLEPMATDLDISHHALSETEEALRSVPVEMEKASTQMSEQARMIEKIRDEIAG